MPIRKELQHLYRTPGWKAARKEALERAGYKCEECGVPKSLGRVNRWKGWWQNPDTLRWHDEAGKPRTEIPPYSERRNNVRLTVGVAHLNGVAGDDRPQNLRVLCDCCHLKHDMP